MAGTKYTNPVYLDSDWENQTIVNDIQKIGWYNIDFTNLDATTESEIASGSSIEVNGVVYRFNTQESIIGSETSSSTNYIRVYESSNTLLAEYTNVEPEWDQSKKGWYDSATGLKRYVMKFYFDGTYYLSKKVIDNTKIEVLGDVANVSSDYTIPDGDTTKVYMVTTTDTAKVTITLPDAENNKGNTIKVLKSSNTFAPVVIDTNGTQTINDWEYTIDSIDYQLVPIFFNSECIEVVSDGSNWIVINDYTPTYDTGLCFPGIRPEGLEVSQERITVTSKTGNYELFEVITGGTSGQSAIISNIISGSNYLYLLQASPYNKTTGQTGPFQTETLTGGTSGATSTYSTCAYSGITMIYPFNNRGKYEIRSGCSYRKELKSRFYVQLNNSTTEWAYNTNFLLNILDSSSSVSGNFGHIEKIDTRYDWSNVSILISNSGSANGGILLYNQSSGEILPYYGVGATGWMYRLIVKG